MKVNEVDKNFDTTFECPSDIKWHSVLNKPFSIHGVIYSKEEGLFRRLPKEFAAAINENVAFLAKNTAGEGLDLKLIPHISPFKLKSLLMNRFPI